MYGSRFQSSFWINGSGVLMNVWVHGSKVYYKFSASCSYRPGFQIFLSKLYGLGVPSPVWSQSSNFVCPEFQSSL